MDAAPELDPATLERLERTRAGEDTSLRLRAATLEPGRSGVLEATVRQVSPPRTFQRKRGGEGSLQRVTLDDGTGEVELVLWDDEARFVRDGPLVPGARVRLRGPTVREGWRGGVELHLGACVPEPLDERVAVDVVGEVVGLGETEPVLDGDGPRFRAEVRLRSDAGEVLVVLWDDALKRVRDGGEGTWWSLSGLTPHPALEGWFLGDGATVRPATG